jgi:hypothetical protein
MERVLVYVASQGACECFPDAAPAASDPGRLRKTRKQRVAGRNRRALSIWSGTT